MKHLFTSVIALLVTFAVAAQPGAQQIPVIPADKAVRVGQLPNGMKYYLRHNDKQKNLADFYISHDVGAIQEEDDQQGLAHFLEHMAFNGTKNLPGKMLIEYLETVGVKFGVNLNAGTSWDYTQYLLKDVPTIRPGIVDTAMLILHDWSHFIALQPKEIDSERGVIMEELRTTDGAQRRASMKLIESLGKGTRYAERNLIGHLDGLASFPHSAIRNFYEKWYRPELMTFIVVGDIDVDQIEQKIRALMADVPVSPADAAQKEVIMIPDNQEPIISIFTDPEMQRSQATLYVKHQALPKEVNSTIMASLISMIDSYLSVMANARLEEITMKPEAPFLSGYIYNGSVGIMPTLETAMLGVTTKDGELAQGFAAALLELERLRRHGFTLGEFERAKAQIQAQIDRQYANRNDNMHHYYVQRYMNNFRLNSAIPDAETEYQVDSQLLQMITVDMVNARLKELFTDHNQVVCINAPEKEGLQNPTEEMVLSILKAVAALPAEAVEPYADTTVIEPLVAPDAPLKGSAVKSEVKNETLGTIEWTLKNGTKIVVKPTTFKADEVLFFARGNGGSSMIADADEAAIAEQFLPTLRGMMGVSKFSAVELQKQLSGKNVSLAPSVGQITQGLRGNASPKDIETLLQLVYLNFTAPRFDEGDFQTFYNQYKNYLVNMNSNPDYLFQKELVGTIYGGNPRSQIISAELLDKVKFERLSAINAELFPDAKNVGLLYCSGEPNSKYQAAVMTNELAGLNIAVKEFTFSDSNDVANVTANACGEVDVLYIPTDNTAAANTEAIANVVLPAQIPVVAGESGICGGCGIATLSIDYYDLGYETGNMAAQILTGKADIATMPVKFAPNVTKMYNAANCTALGVQVPDGYVVIE